MEMLDKEYQYYQAHKEELIEQYEGRYVVIVGEKVVGDYETEIEAVVSARKSYEPGTFLVQLCTRDEEAEVMRFHSRVSFSSNA